MQTRTMKPFTEQNYYEVLEVSPDELPLGIRLAYKKSFELYQENSIASYSFFSEDERQEILSRIEQAYLTLINPETRKEYDQSLIASGLLEEERTFRDRTKKPIAIYNFQKTLLDSPAPARRFGELKLRIEQNPVIRDLLARDILGGSDLQKLRTVLDVTLEAIAEKTNIRIDILRAIETENLDLFPPLVYLKGFLRSYIRYLGLDERVVLDAYLKKLGLH
ncbi:MAG: helix-turn-helix domain-containing protein [Pseudomonadota bacterium]